MQMKVLVPAMLAVCVSLAVYADVVSNQPAGPTNSPAYLNSGTNNIVDDGGSLMVVKPSQPQTPTLPSVAPGQKAPSANPPISAPSMPAEYPKMNPAATMPNMPGAQQANPAAAPAQPPASEPQEPSEEPSSDEAPAAEGQ